MGPLKETFKERVGSPNASLALLAAVGFVFAYPFLAFLATSAIRFDPADLSVEFAEVLAATVGRSLLQAFLSAAAATAIGAVVGVCAFLLPWRRWPAAFAAFEASAYLFFALPGTAAALFVIFLTRHATRVEAVGLGAIVAAHALLNFGMVAFACFCRLAAWESSAGREQLEAALCLGASRARTLVAFVPRLVRDECRRWFALVFLFSFSAFSTVLILGGGPEHSTPEVLLFYALATESSGTRLLLTALLQLFVASLGLWLARTRSSQHIAAFAPALPAHARAVEALRSPNPRGTVLIFALALLPLAAFLLWPVGEILRSVLWIRGVDSAYSYGDLATATGLSFTLAALAAFFAWIFYRIAVSTYPFLRRKIALGLAVSHTLLLVGWNGSSFADRLPEAAWLRLPIVAFLLAAAFLPMTCFWIESRYEALSAETVESALLLGCGFRRLPARVVRPFLRDIEWRVPSAVALLAVGEIAVSTFFLADLPLLPLLSRRMAARYDFRGAAWILASLALATLALYALKACGRRDREKEVAVA